METVLLVITILSVAAAIIAFTSARRVRRSERERSEARVAALAAAADTHGSSDGGWTQVAGEWQWTPEPGVMRGPDMAPVGIGDSGLGIRSARVTEQIPIPESQIPVSSERFFGTVERDEPARGRLVLAAAAALIIMLGGALVFLSNSSEGQNAGTVAVVAHSDPLELVSLGHAREARLLTITGTVRNPSSGTKLEGLTAVVSLLNNNGTLISTKDVPLDYRALGPGEEAPFKVSVPDPGSVARYRVSFRAGTDVVPHVDRRSDTKLASTLR
jgi:type II secretory pathway pseudopilin PulG